MKPIHSINNNMAANKQRSQIHPPPPQNRANTLTQNRIIPQKPRKGLNRKIHLNQNPWH